MYRVQKSVSAMLRFRGNILVLLVLLCTATALHAFAVGKSTAALTTHAGRDIHAIKWLKKDAPLDSDCREQLDIPCYSPQEMRNAYNLTSTVGAGYVGSGQTIVIIDSFGSPTALADLKQFDTDYGLPDPPSFKVIAPLGTVAFDPNNADQNGWAQETDLDVQWAHALAPGANIVLLTSPVSETQGIQGMPEFLALEQYTLVHHLGNIISQSWGTTEETLFTPAGKRILNDFNTIYQEDAAQHISVFASAGDTGSANPDTNGNTYAVPTVGFPASSPWVTSVGGTSLYATSNGSYQSETTWNDGIGSATGGGYSAYFKAPQYQQTTLPAPVQAASHGYRGLPDIAYNADPNTSIPVYLGFMSSPGYYLFGGTSAGSPQWAGIIADANQQAGHPLGFLNNKLYQIGSNPQAFSNAFHDITSGNNAQEPIPGYNATTGWDAVTGWGTPDAGILIPALIQN